jgi:sortase A
MISDARAYNKKLMGSVSVVDPFTNTVEQEDPSYDELLKIDDTGMMGYIEIPKIDILLPIYHGTSEEVLHVRSGHLKIHRFRSRKEQSCCVVRTSRACQCQDLYGS